MSPRKHKLSVSDDEDYCLLGIVSDEPDYKLCWLINERLKLSLAKADDIVLFNKKVNEELVYPLFQYEDEATMIVYRIIGNRIDAAYFLPELKNIDYVLHMQGDINTNDIQKVITDLLSVETIRMCMPVDLKKIKQKERLHLW